MIASALLAVDTIAANWPQLAAFAVVSGQWFEMRYRIKLIEETLSGKRK